MNWVEPTEAARAGLERWAAGRPEVIRRLARDFPPWKLYRLNGGQRVTILSINESGTFTVAVRADFNLVGMERGVFGIKPEDLEECDLPEDGDLVGTANLSIEEVKAILAKEKRWPDLEERHLDVRRFKRSDWPIKPGPIGEEDLHRGPE